MASGVIVIDMLNTYEHEDADALKPSVAKILDPLSWLIKAAPEADVMTIYVNDNYGDWSVGSRELGAKALDGASPELVEPILPPDDIPFVVKARHSIFYQTPLEYMLRSNDIDRIVLTGQVTEQCVLYSALDGYVRHFEVVVPRDGVAHIHEDLAQAALRMMERNMQAQVVGSTRDALATAKG